MSILDTVEWTANGEFPYSVMGNRGACFRTLGITEEGPTHNRPMVTMSAESWDHVCPHVARLLELETELAIASES